MTARRVELQIDELVLDGLPPSEAAAVGAAVEQELTRLVRERGVPDRGRTIEAAAPVEIDRRSGDAPTVLGARVAGAIYRRLGA